MKTLNLLLFYTLFLIGIFGLSIFSCKKNDFLDDDTGNLKLKSFPAIKIVDTLISSTEATVNFNITDLEAKDTIKNKFIVFWEKDTPSLRDSLPISLSNNFGLLPGLNPGTTYETKICVFTCDMINRYFCSEIIEFTTTLLTVIIDDEFLEDFQNLRVSAVGIIEDYNQILNQSSLEIVGVGFNWNSGDTIIKTFSKVDAISIAGLFQADLRYFDFTKDYIVTAFVQVKVNGQLGSDIESVISDTLFASENTRDFWVNVANLPPYNNLNNEVITQEENGEIFNENMPVLEGAISFEKDGHIYMGLGRNPLAATSLDRYPTLFYKYNPWRNTWKEVFSDFPTNKGRMHAVSFKAGEDVFVGSGCRNCVGYDEFVVDTNSFSGVDEVVFLDDFFRLTSTGWEEVTAPLPNKIFAGYGYSNNGMGYVGGGLYKGFKEGDLNGDSIINPKEWHDLNDDGIISSKDFDSEMNISEQEACNILDGTITKTFCILCGCPNNNCNPMNPAIGQENINFVIEDNNNVLTYKLVGATTNSEYYNGSVFNPNHLIQMHVTLFNGMTTLGDFFWKDDGLTKGLIEISEITNPPSQFDSVRLVNGIWSQGMNSATGFNFDLNLGTIYCGVNLNIEIDLSQLYYDTTLPEYYEWIDYNPMNGIWDSTELTFEFKPQNISYQFAGNGWLPTSSEPYKRYGATIFQFDNDPYLIAGDSVIPFDQNNPVKHIVPIANINAPWTQIDDFKPRVHPFSFVINNSKGYIGGGEQENGEEVNFDLWQFDPDTQVFSQVAGCAISGITRAVGFSTEGKGYIYGKIVDNGIDTKQFWTYIPPN